MHDCDNAIMFVMYTCGSLILPLYYSLKLTRMVALSGTSYCRFNLLALGWIKPRLLKSMPQVMLAENVVGRPEGKLVRSKVTAIIGVL